MKIKNILFIAIVCIACTNSMAQENPTISVAENLCSCMDKIKIKEDKLEIIVATAKDKKVAEVDNQAKQLEILKDLFGCMNDLTKNELWKNKKNQSTIYEYIKANCEDYSGLIVFTGLSNKINTPKKENKIVTKKTAKDYRLMGIAAFDKEDYFYVREYCEKAIKLDSTDTEKNIIVEHFFKIGKNWLKSANEYEKEGKIPYARKYRFDADLALVLAFDFDYPNRTDIGKVIYNNRIILGDKVGANLYEKYK